ncbi:hypothetical protein, partial [Terasakiella pusilla]|uniref:hypothetical protein n=1 Tax=Terasakiella pusilla TaxID=64973 RepID=UPI003AA7F429
MKSNNYTFSHFSTCNSNEQGQLLVQEVIEYMKYRGPVQRLLISDLNKPAVSRALAKLRSNAEY